jgi:hypothetical protein
MVHCCRCVGWLAQPGACCWLLVLFACAFRNVLWMSFCAPLLVGWLRIEGGSVKPAERWGAAAVACAVLAQWHVRAWRGPKPLCSGAVDGCWDVCTTRHHLASICARSSRGVVVFAQQQLPAVVLTTPSCSTVAHRAAVATGCRAAGQLPAQPALHVGSSRPTFPSDSPFPPPALTYNFLPLNLRCAARPSRTP